MGEPLLQWSADSQDLWGATTSRGGMWRHHLLKGKSREAGFSPSFEERTKESSWSLFLSCCKFQHKIRKREELSRGQRWRAGWCSGWGWGRRRRGQRCLHTVTFCCVRTEAAFVKPASRNNFYAVFQGCTIHHSVTWRQMQLSSLFSLCSLEYASHLVINFWHAFLCPR